MNNLDQWSGLMGVMIPIVAILMPVAIVFIALYFRHQRQVSLHETIKHLADKGMPAWEPSLGHRKTEQVAAFVLSLRGSNVAGKASQGTEDLGD